MNELLNPTLNNQPPPFLKFELGTYGMTGGGCTWTGYGSCPPPRPKVAASYCYSELGNCIGDFTYSYNTSNLTTPNNFTNITFSDVDISNSSQQILDAYSNSLSPCESYGSTTNSQTLLIEDIWEYGDGTTEILYTTLNNPTLNSSYQQSVKPNHNYQNSMNGYWNICHTKNIYNACITGYLANGDPKIGNKELLLNCTVCQEICLLYQLDIDALNKEGGSNCDANFNIYTNTKFNNIPPSEFLYSFQDNSNNNLVNYISSLMNPSLCNQNSPPSIIVTDTWDVDCFPPQNTLQYTNSNIYSAINSSTTFTTPPLLISFFSTNSATVCHKKTFEIVCNTNNPDDFPTKKIISECKSCVDLCLNNPQITENTGFRPEGVIPNPERSDIAIYPNPANDFVTVSVENATAETTITLTDFAGKVVYTTTANGNHISEKINTKGLANGIYNLTIKSANETATHKVSVAH
ncbi:MAG: T9SS type A sorting domain-containing protein [Chitinophagaceae bacterium]